MDSVVGLHATEKLIKQNRIKTTPKKNGRGGNFISNNPSENFDTYAGLLNPPSRAVSLSYQYGQNLQPPLLPLPHVSAIHHQQQQPLLSRSLSTQVPSHPPPSRKGRSRDMSLTPKKSKPTKREEAKKRSGTQSISEFFISASENRWGPDPKDLPKHLPVVLLPGSGVSTVGNMDVFSGSVFNSLSPPPSSLPLPKFSLQRSKLSCNAEAAAGSVVDAGATNNLRRLLRLR